MGTPVDGIRPVMNMGLVSRTNRHTAFDSDVVYHEFMHGVTNRLVAGRIDEHALIHLKVAEWAKAGATMLPVLSTKKP